MNLAGQRYIPAGSKTIDIFFDQPAAYLVGAGTCYNNEQYPEPTLFFMFQRNKNEQKQVKRDPGRGISYVRHDPIKKWVAPFVVNNKKEIPVKLQNSFKKWHNEKLGRI